MKRILVTFATAATLLLTPNAFADDATKNETQAQEVAEQQTKTILADNFRSCMVLQI